MGEIEKDELAPDVLQRALGLIHKYTGITMGESKKTLIEGRLRRRIRELALPSFEKYLDYLEAHSDEGQKFINLVTTNETSFFRTERVWEYLQKEFLPAWYKQNLGKTLRIWSAASSTGEEVYTIGICCQDFRLTHPSFDFQIVGTDIDTGVLALAEKGEYQGRSIENFKTTRGPLFERYMAPVQEKFRVIEEVRKKINFRIHNLFRPPLAREQFDLIFLRNVLIYFDAEDQEKVLAHVNSSLAPAGLLVIGESESLTRLKTVFHFKAPLIYERTGS